MTAKVLLLDHNIIYQTNPACFKGYYFVTFNTDLIRSIFLMLNISGELAARHTFERLSDGRNPLGTALELSQANPFPFFLKAFDGSILVKVVESYRSEEELCNRPHCNVTIAMFNIRYMASATSSHRKGASTSNTDIVWKSWLLIH